MNCHGYIRVAQVPERVSTMSFVVLSIGNSKSNHVGAQGTFKGACFRDDPTGVGVGSLHRLGVS